jgi:hypothetical protein
MQQRERYFFAGFFYYGNERQETSNGWIKSQYTDE